MRRRPMRRNRNRRLTGCRSCKVTRLVHGWREVQAGLPTRFYRFYFQKKEKTLGRETMRKADTIRVATYAGPGADPVW